MTGFPIKAPWYEWEVPEHILLVRKDIRAQIGKQPGDRVEVTLEEDTTPRIVVVPEDLKAAMGDSPELVTFFEQLSYTHQKEYVQWIEGAKKQETRLRRIQKAIEMMQAGKKGV